MNKKEIIKTVSMLVVGMGVTNVVKNVANDAAPEDSSGLLKAITWIGVVAIGWFVADKVMDYMEPSIDNTIRYFDKLVIKVKDEQK